MITAVDAYKQAWHAYRANLKPFALNGIVLLLITFLAVGIAVAAAMLPAFGGMALFGANSNAATVLAIASMAISIAVSIAAATLQKAFYGVSDDLMEGREVKPYGFLMHAKHRFWVLAGIASIQVGIIMLITVLFVSLPMAMLASSSTGMATVLLALGLGILSIPFIIAAVLLFEPAFPIAIVECTGVFASIKGGFALIRKNLKQYLVLSVISFALDLLNLVPAAQQVVTIPINSTALLIFYRAGREGKPGKKRR